MTTIDDTLNPLLTALLGFDANGRAHDRLRDCPLAGAPAVQHLATHFARSRTLLRAFADAVIAEARRPAEPVPVEKPARRPLPNGWGWFTPRGGTGYALARSQKDANDENWIAGVDRRVVHVFLGERDLAVARSIVVPPGEDPRAIAEDECWARGLFGAASEKPEPIEPGDRFRNVETQALRRAVEKTAETTWRMSSDDGEERFADEAMLLDPTRYERLPREPRPVDAAPSELTATPLRTGGIDHDAARAAMPELERRLAEQEPLTEDDLAAIDARHTAATGGRWRLSRTHPEERPETNEVCDLVNDLWIITDAHLSSPEADGAFIECAHEFMPRLVAEVRRLRREFSAYKKGST